ncbi:glycosyltransferase family 4 protein [Haloimpatiens lingqiaonensis]|uniref:glycosyltransferase family 4 protein n=1 Tax=Haloimpatiens lingqiaonensis TaxID=1380675 RepID=UPI0010FDA380|nr:glycosyltransferase family 1 protein [Haloimpatiens lingqiaonensis]
MKIAIDGRGATWYSGTGIGTYTENLIKELVQIDKSNFYNIYWSGNNYDSLQRENTKILITSERHKKFFEHNYFPCNLQKMNVDLYHIPQNGIGFSSDIKCKTVATIHDLIPYTMPETVGKGYLIKFLKEMPYIINSCHGILTVSEFSKKDILKYFPINPERVFVTPLAANFRYRPYRKDRCKSLIKKRFNIEKPFILYLGGFSQRKNIKSLLISFSKIYKDLNQEYNLVILGSYKEEGKPLVKLCEDLNIIDRVIFTGFIEDRFLPVFYNACDVFVYPSLYEGFGLPPLEAMSCGAPVITSNTTSIPEVVGESAILINPLNLEEISTALCHVLNNESVKKELRNKGLARAKNFSWRKTAQLTIEAYNKIAGM